MSVNNGGSAFPNKSSACGGSSLDSNGMTLRDYFASKAMQGLLASSSIEEALSSGEQQRVIDTIVDISNHIAAKMVRARP